MSTALMSVHAITSCLRRSSIFLQPFNFTVYRCLCSQDGPSQATLDQISSTDLFTSKDIAITPSKLQAASRHTYVTKVLKATESAEAAHALQRWRCKMISVMGEDAFFEYSEGLLRRGKAIHFTIAQHLVGEEGEIDVEAAPYFNSVSAELSNFHGVHACEKRLSHGSLPYSGMIDCVSHYSSSGLCVIDWKTSSKKKTSAHQTFDSPLQLAAYAGLWNSNYTHNQVSQGILVMMYADGSPCNVIKVSEKALRMYWKQWISRLRQYWQQQMDEYTSY